MAKEKKPKGPKASLAMGIARSHNLSTQFAGLQMSLAYMAALALSVLSITVGISVQIVTQFPSLPLALSIVGGLLLGAFGAFLLDGLTISSLKRIKATTSGATRFFNSISMLLGITFSTFLGDKMWAIIFPGSFMAPALASAISLILVFTELWPKEHEEAIKHASKRSDIITHAIREESVASLEDMQRSTKFELFNDPTFKAEIRDDIREVARNEIATQLRQQLRGAGHVDVKELRSDLQQDLLPAAQPGAQPQLPASGESSASKAPQAQDADQQGQAQDATQATTASNKGTQAAPQAAPRRAQPRNKTTSPATQTRALQIVPKRNQTASDVARVAARLQRAGKPASAAAVARELGITRQAVARYAPFKVEVIEGEVKELESNQDTQEAQPEEQAIDLLDETIELLSQNPDLSNQELATALGLTKSASAIYWKLRAQAVMSREEAVNE